MFQHRFVVIARTDTFVQVDDLLDCIDRIRPNHFCTNSFHSSGAALFNQQFGTYDPFFPLRIIHQWIRFEVVMTFTFRPVSGRKRFRNERSLCVCVSANIRIQNCNFTVSVCTTWLYAFALFSFYFCPWVDTQHTAQHITAHNMVLFK